VRKYDRAGQAADDNMTRLMRTACWITKPADTQTEYVIFIAFPRQHSLPERASICRLYVHCLSCIIPQSVVGASSGDTARLNARL
jgi:hypothetical protein